MKEALRKFFGYFLRDHKDEDTPSETAPLRYRINPCDIDHFEALTPLQSFFEFFSAGTDCKCCLGARIFMALVVGFILGALVL